MLHKGRTQCSLGEDFVNTYKTGTKPEKFVDAAEIERIKQLFFSTLDQLEIDYNNNFLKAILQ